MHTVDILLPDDNNLFIPHLTHSGWVMRIWVSKLAIIDLDNGLLPSLHQAIISTNAGIFLIWHLGTNFSEISSALLWKSACQWERGWDKYTQITFSE